MLLIDWLVYVYFSFQAPKDVAVRIGLSLLTLLTCGPSCNFSDNIP